MLERWQDVLPWKCKVMALQSRLHTPAIKVTAERACHWPRETKWAMTSESGTCKLILCSSFVSMVHRHLVYAVSN